MKVPLVNLKKEKKEKEISCKNWNPKRNGPVSRVILLTLFFIRRCLVDNPNIHCLEKGKTEVLLGIKHFSNAVSKETI